MTHGSLFSGIGGFDLAAEWAGWENTFHCEWNTFGQKVLKHHFPNSISYHDITKTDFTIHRGKIDILTGGFPCQPYSQAGKRLGKEDDRHLWPHMLRAIYEIQPRYVVGENVHGLINWNGGMVFDEVQADLEAAGYSVIPVVLPACAVNAPHRRDRIWFVAQNSNNVTPNANAKSDRDRGELLRLEGENGGERQPEKYGENNLQSGNNGKVKFAPNAEGERSRILRNESEEKGSCGGDELLREQRGISSEKRYVPNAESKRHEQSCTWDKEFSAQAGQGLYGRGSVRYGERPNWQNFPTQSPICNGDDGLSTRLDGITFPKWRNESIKAGGNAIVPHVAFEFFKVINQIEARKQ
jgi:DNA (cytosine-5)-methyltransferase 1